MILNRRRFLSKYGFDELSHMQHGSASTLKTQAVGLLHAAQYLKVPVIAANILVIFFELLLGG
jgi:immediate early response 3-interacting protein 1